MDFKHQLYLAYIAANDPTERNRATQRIKELMTELIERRNERAKPVSTSATGANI